MNDMTLCANSQCEARKSCTRYLAYPKPQGQSYGWFSGGLMCKERHDMNHTTQALRDWRDVDAEYKSTKRKKA